MAVDITEQPDNPGTSPQPAAWRELIAVSACAIGITVFLGFTDVDMQLAAQFYNPDGPQAWPLAEHPFWQWVYDSAPVLTILLLAGGLVTFAGSWFSPRWRRWRRHGLLLALTLIVGPGLVVNVVLKEHWGRPRPRQVEALGGTMPYQPPLLNGPPGGGKSFSAGHSSVVFAYLSLWYALRRRHPRAAAAVMAGIVGGGIVMGLQRMLAGGHFLSDVVWSGWVCFVTAWVLYYRILRIPESEDRCLRADGEDSSADL